MVGPGQSGSACVPMLLIQTRQSAAPAASVALVDQRTGSWSGPPEAKLVRNGPPVCQAQTWLTPTMLSGPTSGTPEQRPLALRSRISPARVPVTRSGWLPGRSRAAQRITG